MSLFLKNLTVLPEDIGVRTSRTNTLKGQAHGGCLVWGQGNDPEH